MKTFYKDFRSKEAGKNKISYEKYKKYYDEYLLYGGFPQVVLEEEKEKEEEVEIKEEGEIMELAKPEDEVEEAEEAGEEGV